MSAGSAARMPISISTSTQHAASAARCTASGGASLLEATERGFYLGIGCELAALGLRKPFQHRGKMREIDFLWLSLMAAEGQHGERDFILAVMGQAPIRHL